MAAGSRKGLPWLSRAESPPAAAMLSASVLPVRAWRSSNAPAGKRANRQRLPIRPRPNHTASSHLRASTSMSWCGVMPAARSAATAPMPAITPAAPSKLPPCTILSRWDPMIIGDAFGLSAAQRRERLAPASILACMPSASPAWRIRSCASFSPRP